jgi:3-oxoacyl-[acyl-carrier-protein] synthase III
MSSSQATAPAASTVPHAGPRLSILGMGLELPPSVSMRELLDRTGGDTSWYNSWQRACRVRNDEDQPSTFASAALKKALAASGVPAADIRLVLFTGVSRDYPASWSVATEVMRLNGISEDCVGIDMTIGCLATLSALDLAQGWLAQRGGGSAAIVAGERWSYTVDQNNPKVAGMWTWADGGAAIVVGMNTGRPAIADFLGAEFTSRSDYNGHVLISYGGTRNPVAPAGVNPYQREVSDRPRHEVKQAYLHGYRRAYDAISRRAGGLRAQRMVCNQMSPQTVSMIAESFGIPMERVVITGHETGHLGACDAIVGLNRLRELNQIDAPIVIGSSTAYAFGAGLVVPPTWSPS